MGFSYVPTNHLFVGTFGRSGFPPETGRVSRSDFGDIPGRGEPPLRR